MTVGQGVCGNILTRFKGRFYAQRFQVRFVYLNIKMSGVGQQHAVFHHFHVFFADDILATRNGDKDIAFLRGFRHGQGFKSVKYRFNAFDGIHFRDDDPGTHAFGPHGHAFAAPAVTGNHHGLPRHNQVAGPHDAVPHTLAGTVAVVK